MTNQHQDESNRKLIVNLLSQLDTNKFPDQSFNLIDHVSSTDLNYPTWLNDWCNIIKSNKYDVIKTHTVEKLSYCYVEYITTFHVKKIV